MAVPLAISHNRAKYVSSRWHKGIIVHRRSDIGIITQMNRHTISIINILAAIDGEPYVVRVMLAYCLPHGEAAFSMHEMPSW